MKYSKLTIGQKCKIAFDLCILLDYKIAQHIHDIIKKMNPDIYIIGDKIKLYKSDIKKIEKILKEKSALSLA
jgi:hypothetical protein